MAEKQSKKSPLSRIWTAVVGNLDVQYIRFEDAIYEEYARQNNIEYDKLEEVRYMFDKDILGAHVSVNGDITEFDRNRYIKFVSDLVRLKDDKAVVYGIVHDSDVSRDDDGGLVYDNGSKQFSVADKHMHLLIKFSKPFRVSAVQACTGITEHMIERGKVKGKYAFSSAMAYLVHAFDPDKHQYEPEEVIDGAYNKLVPNGKYVNYYKSHSTDWANRLAKNESGKRKIDVDAVVKAVAYGKYTIDDLIRSKDDNLYMTYVDNSKRIKEARNAYLQRAFAEYTEKVNNGEIKLETLFISGPSGMGKSELAKRVATKFSKLSGLRVNTGTSSEHVLESYDGEGIIILDDLRANSMSPTEWLHLLDPSNASELSARYRNTKPMGWLIIITSVKPPHEYFSEMRTVGNEPLDQFLRRVSLNCRVVKMDDIDVGRLTKLRVSHILKRPNYQNTVNTNKDNTRDVSYKVGKSQEFNYGYVKSGNGTLEEVATNLANYYADIFGFTKTQSAIAQGQGQDTDPIYPILSDSAAILLPVTQTQTERVSDGIVNFEYEMTGSGTNVTHHYDYDSIDFDSIIDDDDGESNIVVTSDSNDDDERV